MTKQLRLLSVVPSALLPNEIGVDLFAGGGGWSEGFSWATGVPPAVAVNHDEDAIVMHTANHPETEHHHTDVFEVDPVEATRGRAVGWLHLSPDCTHFSRAKGGKPRSQKIRALAWVAITWAEKVSPRIISLENVAEFVTWGPLDDHGQPIKERAGETFREFVGRLEALGYEVQWRKLNAAEYGAPTSRTRLFLIARRDGKPISWPKPTHGKGKGRKPFRTAAECIDWSIPIPSIFDRKKPLADATLRRIAEGIRRYVLENPRPFLVTLTHGGRIEDLDALLLFRKPPTDNSNSYSDVPVVKSKDRYSRSRWQVDAHGFMRSSGDRPLMPEDLAGIPHERIFKLFREYSLTNVYDFEHHVRLGEDLELRGSLPVTFMLLQPQSWSPEVWSDITRMLTLNGAQSSKGKEMHLCPMQFDLADRVIEQMSNPDDVVFDPFGGLMTVPYRAILKGRRGYACELSPAYFLDGVAYCKAAEEQMAMPSLFDLADGAA